MSRSRSVGRSDSRTDEELLKATSSDSEAFGAFYDRHFRNLVAYFWVRTRDAEISADLAAETFAVVLSDMQKFDPSRGNPSQWVYGIAANQLKRYWRRGAASRRARDRLGLQELQPPTELPGEILAAEARLDAGRLRSALERLPGRYRLAVSLRVIDELSYDEIAGQVGCSNNAARVRVFRGLKQLRTEFESGGVNNG